MRLGPRARSLSTLLGFLAGAMIAAPAQAQHHARLSSVLQKHLERGPSGTLEVLVVGPQWEIHLRASPDGL
jgi:hypothetical protein